jgi:phenylpropionate dioxygenase-like ring-hydroxylating dioxygenase large terminal subunit
MGGDYAISQRRLQNCLLAPSTRHLQDMTMALSSGHWYPVLSSRELKTGPVAKTRFGERLVFWRDSSDRATCFDDRYAHRGAALSLGKVSGGAIRQAP